MSDIENDEYILAFDELKPPKLKDELEQLSLKIAEKTRELSNLYSEFNQKLAKFKKNDLFS